MKDIKIRLWDEQKFTSSQKEWTELLERSHSDKLFMSWEWLSTWWDVFSEPDTMQLRLFVALDSAGALIGIAPLYLTTVSTKKIHNTKRLQFIGNSWRGPSTMRTELQDFIVDKSCSREVIAAFYYHLNSLSEWDELVLADLNKNSKTYHILESGKILKNSYYRYAEEFDSYHLNIAGDFSDFCSSLGKNTRLKLLNRRKLLETIGVVEFSEVKGGDLSSSFDLLNSLHVKRWGKPIFEGKRLHFNRTVAQRMALKDALQFSIITVDDKPVSIQYNYILDKHEYNIQAGFDEKFHKKISLGYLHFGYEIESAFKKNIDVYDFLAGEGKNTQYKERLTGSTESMVSLQIIRNKVLQVLYRSYDFFF